MRILLRQVVKLDLEIIQNWFVNIKGNQYTSRYGPQSFDGQEACKQEEYVWYVIQADEQDCGVIWLEKDAKNKNEAVLGIMLGEERYFCKEIGQKAIFLTINQAMKYLSFNKVCLHVRKNNARAIKCYNKFGFSLDGEGEEKKRGQKINFWTMVLDLCKRSDEA